MGRRVSSIAKISCTSSISKVSPEAREHTYPTTTSELINTQFEDYVMCMVGILKEVSADGRMDGQTYFRYTF